MESISVLDYEWPCPSCTYINKAGSFKCFMCGTPKGTSTRQVKFHMSALEQQYVAESLQSLRLHSSKPSNKLPHSSSSSGVTTSRKKLKTKASSSATSSSSSSSNSSSNSSRKGLPYRWPKLPNIDRSNSISRPITVNSVTVIITEYETLYSDSD